MSFEFVNICGLGFVGGSVSYLCRENNVKYSVYDVIDKNDPNSVGVFKDISEFVKNSEAQNTDNFYFICVPTPSRPSGECNTSIVESVVDSLYTHHTKRTFVLVKSTVQPGTCRKLHERYANENFTILFVPEFLTERRANLDMYEAKFAMFGTHDGNEVQQAIGVFKQLYKHNENLECVTRKYEACEIFKYTINVFLGVKVWFFNEVYEICEKFDVEYNTLRDLLPYDPRIGMSHTMVPGVDGKRSFSGACIPKEVAATIWYQHQLGIPNTVLKEIYKRNAELREKPIKQKQE
jgi:UDPglucose 6-dehydrogenase